MNTIGTIAGIVALLYFAVYAWGTMGSEPIGFALLALALFGFAHLFMAVIADINWTMGKRNKE